MAVAFIGDSSSCRSKYSSTSALNAASGEVGGGVPAQATRRRSGQQDADMFSCADGSRRARVITARPRRVVAILARAWHPSRRYSPPEPLMLVGPKVRRVAVVGGMRIPFARGHGAYARVGNQDMFTAVLQALVAKYRIAGERLGDVTGGAVLKHSKDFNLVRECVLSSGLDPATPGIDMQRACGTGLDAAISIAMKIALGQMDAGIAGGFDTVSDPPIVYPRSYQQLLLRAYPRQDARGSASSRSSACGPGISSR